MTRCRASSNPRSSGIGGTYEMIDEDGEGVGVVVLRGGGMLLLIWPERDNEAVAVEGVGARQARQLAVALFDLWSPGDVDVTVPGESRPDRLSSHAGTPLPPADPRRLRQVTDSVRRPDKVRRPVGADAVTAPRP
jgi:hypothetical protein